MVKADWDELAGLASLLFDQETRKLSNLRSEEARLDLKRRKLADLNDRALDAFANPHPAHWHNGDIHWQNWVGQNVHALNLEEAKLRAEREIHKPALIRAFGRKRVLEQIAQGRNR